MKRSLHTRTKTGILMGIYGVSILFLFTLTDKTNDGWSRYIPDNIHRYVSFAFAIVCILGIAWITIFVAKELHNCFVKTKNRKQFLFLAISMLAIQLIPAVIWIIPNYFEIPHGQYLGWFLGFLLSGVGLIVAFYPFYFKMVKNGTSPTKFNLIVFPLITVCISIAFGCVYYLCIVRYWTTIVILIFLVCGCDIAAYFFGILFGKHKMSPVISPKKSYEGAIGGSLTAVLISILLIYLLSLIVHANNSSMDVPYNFFGAQFLNYFSDWYQKWLWWIILAFIMIVLAILTIFGDLLFSLLKRRNKIKDFSTSLPGHGGYLDRMDSFLVVIFSFTILMFVVSLGTSLYNNLIHHDPQLWHGFRAVFPGWFE